MINKIKAELANFVFKFISVQEKLSYMFLETSLSNLNPIVILPSVNTALKLLISKLKNKSVHGLVCNGKLNNIEVSVIQTNVGSPSTAIIMEVLKRSPCKIAIRLDYCGGLRTTSVNGSMIETGIEIGNILIPKTVYLTDGNAMQYLQKFRNEITGNPLFQQHIAEKDDTWMYPQLNGVYWSVDCSEKLYDLFTSANDKNMSYFEWGHKLWSSDALFCEEETAVNLWKSHGCSVVDMESSAVYLLGAIFEIPTISLLGVSNLRDWDEYDLFTKNKIHPGILKALDDCLSLLMAKLPLIYQQFVEKEKKT